MSKKKKDWKTEKERLLRLDREERRKEYRRQDFVSLDSISTLRQDSRPNDEDEGSELPGGGLRDKVSLYKGDITVLELDAIVNAEFCQIFLFQRFVPPLCNVAVCTQPTHAVRGAERLLHLLLLQLMLTTLLQLWTRLSLSTAVS
uniref:Mono-ADP ribosylhydrolase 2 n=1 Tax=Gasterosteus aculeatus aculeatus TaxID=481459 RepID=A0AAQ4R9E4_GASAC